MTETYAKFKVNKKYGDIADDITYCGVYGVNYVFGMLKKQLIDTVDLPFYITMNDDGEINEVYEPKTQDDYYEESMFARYEDRFHYFTNNKIID